MAARGRKVLPIGRTPEGRADLDAGPVTPPADVAADDAALAAWHETVGALRLLGLWHRADAPAVARYASIRSMYDACLRDIARQGLHVVTGTGYRMPSPAATTAIKLASQLLQLEQSLGLTPRSRARMKLASAGVNTDDKLMKKMCSGQNLSKLEWEQLGRD